MPYGAYFGTQPNTTHAYIDTSQPLNGFGGDDISENLTIYEGVGSTAALPPAGGCGCAGKRGSLRGFGNEVMADPTTTPEVQASLNLKTALTALLVAGSLAAVGYFLLSKGSSPMRANGRRRRKGKRKMRRNGYPSVPAYLLTKKGKTTKRQAKAAGHYLAETRWGGNRKKRVAKWSGKHLAYRRFAKNGAPTWVDVGGETHELMHDGKTVATVSMHHDSGQYIVDAGRESFAVSGLGAAKRAARASYDQALMAAHMKGLAPRVKSARRAIAKKRAPSKRKAAPKRKKAAPKRKRAAAKRRAPARKGKRRAAARRCR